MLHLKGFFPSWTVAMCLFKLTCCVKLAPQGLHFVSFLVFMKWMQCGFSNFLFCSKKRISYITRFLSFMDVIIQKELFCKAKITNVAYKRFLTFINCGIVYIKDDLICIASTTNVVIKRLLFFMNRDNLTIESKFCTKLAPHVVH